MSAVLRRKFLCDYVRCCITDNVCRFADLASPVKLFHKLTGTIAGDLTEVCVTLGKEVLTNAGDVAIKFFTGGYSRKR